MAVHLVIITWYLSSHPSLAIDGDVEYSAPYIMVDPETGQIVTVNPGPRLKAHEIMPATNPDSDISNNMSVTADVNNSATENQASEPSTILPVITIFACLFMVITGFLIWKSNRRKEQGNT